MTERKANSIKTKPLLFIALLTLAATFGLMTQRESTGQASRSAVPEANSAIIGKLEEIVGIRRRMFESEELNIKAGRAPLDSTAEIDLVEARLQLAREKNQRDAVIAELRELVSVHERRLNRNQAFGVDRAPAAALEKLRIGLLEAQVRLLREQK
ncbi:MAG: hypothetical protein FJ403_01800 [Verrucomicrobia bacterium]|nr:hypothetical protein [Verrucomicrobiota bacterium]